MCNRCLYCYEPLAVGEKNYHARCSRKMYHNSVAPILPYRQEDVEQMAQQVIHSQTTLTGVQPKLSLDYESNRRTQERLTIVGLWGRYILKPQTEQYPHLPELEDATMHLATLAKIATVPHSLIRFADGNLCYITRRIDRTNNGQKIAMEDMCQLSERLTEDKYKGSHERLAKIIAQYSSVPMLDLVEYWKQVVFAWIIGNADMHLKNYSLYCPQGNDYVLTPTYDQVSTALVMPQDTEELALTLCGKKRKLNRAHFETAMTASGLNAKTIAHIFEQLIKASNLWPTCLHNSFLPKEMQDSFEELINHKITILTE